MQTFLSSENTECTRKCLGIMCGFSCHGHMDAIPKMLNASVEVEAVQKKSIFDIDDTRLDYISGLEIIYMFSLENIPF